MVTVCRVIAGVAGYTEIAATQQLFDVAVQVVVYDTPDALTVPLSRQDRKSTCLSIVQLCSTPPSHPLFGKIGFSSELTPPALLGASKDMNRHPLRRETL